MHPRKIKFAVPILIIAWLLVSSASSQKGSEGIVMPGVSYADHSYIIGGSNSSQYYIGEQPQDYVSSTEMGPADNTGAGTSNFGVSSSSCSVWTNKKQYSIGEMMTIYYNVGFPCTIQATTRRPDGATSTLGLMNVYPGTFSFQEIASGPPGTYAIILQASDSSIQCKAACAYTVESPASLNRTNSYNSSAQNISQGNRSSM